MKFYNIDLHISVISDIKNIFENLGHTVKTDSISGHHWVMNRDHINDKVINAKNWETINEDLCNLFYETNKEELSKYDGFIVTHTPCFSLLFEKFNKPIITVSSTRYESPVFFQNKEKWEKFNNFLLKGKETGQIIPVANNRYDKKYCEIFTKMEWRHIPSLCEYTKAKYSPKKNAFVLFDRFIPSSIKRKSLCTKIYKKLRLERLKRLLTYDLISIDHIGKYEWNELYSYKGIVHFPYNVSSMSIFEQYTANIPMFFPSKKYIKQIPNALSQVSWNKVFKVEEKSILDVPDDPNKNFMEDRWLGLADFYDEENMKNIVYFNSQEELLHLLKSVDLMDISRKMEEHNKIRKRVVYDSWNELLNEIA